MLNKNNTWSKFQAYHAQVFVQGVIRLAGRKQAQKQIQQVKLKTEGRQTQQLSEYLCCAMLIVNEAITPP